VGVGDDQLGAVSPRAFNELRKAVQKAPSSHVADGEAEHLPVSVGRDAGSDHHRLGDHPVRSCGPAPSTAVSSPSINA
jgi:hypothetical protein